METELDAYMATALTGLDAETKKNVKFISDKVSQVCQRNGIKLYEPWKKTDPVNNPDIPDTEVYLIDREKVATSDLMILLADYPGFGAGMEMEIAALAGVPVLVLVERGKPVTRMVTGSFIQIGKIEYEDPDHLAAQLDGKLREIRPQLAARKDSERAHRSSIGERIARLRHVQRMERSQLAESLGIRESYIEALEEKPDKVSNPSYFLLEQIAQKLGTTVGYLTEGYCIAAILSDRTVRMASFANLYKFTTRKDVPTEVSLRLWAQFEEDIESALSSGARARLSPLSEVDWENRYEELMKPPLL